MTARNFKETNRLLKPYNSSATHKNSKSCMQKCTETPMRILRNFKFVKPSYLTSFWTNSLSTLTKSSPNGPDSTPFSKIIPTKLSNKKKPTTLTLLNNGIRTTSFLMKSKNKMTAISLSHGMMTVVSRIQSRQNNKIQKDSLKVMSGVDSFVFRTWVWLKRNKKTSKCLNNAISFRKISSLLKNRKPKTFYDPIAKGQISKKIVAKSPTKNCTLSF